MLNCLAFGAGEIILIVACVALVAGVIVAKIVRLAKGQTGCSGNCASCRAGCHSQKAQRRGKKQ